jgi:uncharacterized membrane protein
MAFTARSTLSWQTNTLVYRNTTLATVKAELEQRYGTVINLYHRLDQNWVHESRLPQTKASEWRREIRLRLYLYWDQLQDSLVVRGVEG